MITITLYQNHNTIYRLETIPDRNSRNLKKKKDKRQKPNRDL